MLKDVLICWGKEFRLYFQSRIVYLVLFVYAAMSAAFTFYASDFYNNTTVNLYQFFRFQPGIMATIVPALTMRLWADEYRHNTLEVLLSQPVSYAAVAAGKFLAAWSVAGIMLVSSSGFWLITGMMLPLDNGWIIANYLVAFLMTGSLCAVGAAVSAFCYNALAAFLAALVVCMILAMADFSSWAEKLLPDNLLVMQLSKAFDFGQQYNDLISGQVWFAAVAYFVLLIAAALWISIVAVEYKRS